MASTWQERLEEIRHHGPRYPLCLGLYPMQTGQIIAAVAAEQGVPLRISEEWYPDIPDRCVVYIMRECGNLSAYWAEVRRRERGD